METLSALPATGSWYGSVEPMSRHSTPTSAIGRLDLDGSSSSSASGMPTETRSMSKRNRGQDARLASSSAGRRAPAATAGLSRGHNIRQAASSGSGSVTAGPSGTSGSRRTGQTSRPQAGRGAAGAATPDPAGNDDDDDDDDDDDNDDSDGDEDDAGVNNARDNARRQKEAIVSEAFCIYTDAMLTPHEFSGLMENGNGATTAPTERDRLLGQLADTAARGITSIEALQTFRNAAPRQFCLTQIAQRFRQRTTLIEARLNQNVEDQTTGQDVPTTINAFRDVFVAIAGLFGRYGGDLTAMHKSLLVGLLMYVLGWIRTNDKDIYEGSNQARPPYASRSSFNPFRSFLSAQGQPGRFVDVLVGVPPELLRVDERYQNFLYNFCIKVEENVSVDQAWVRKLRQIYERAYT